MKLFKVVSLLLLLCLANNIHAQVFNQLFNGNAKNAQPVSTGQTFLLRNKVDALYQQLLRSNNEQEVWAMRFYGEDEKELFKYPYGLLTCISVRGYCYSVVFGPKPWESDSSWIMIVYTIDSDSESDTFESASGGWEFMWKAVEDKELLGYVYGYRHKDQEGDAISIYQDASYILDHLYLTLCDVQATMDSIEFGTSEEEEEK